MALSTANVYGVYDFRDQAAVFTDAARTTPISAADGSQTILGTTDKSGLARHLSGTVGPTYTTVSGVKAERWLGKTAQRDKWIVSLKAVRSGRIQEA